MSEAPTPPRVFRLPALTYIVVLFLLFGAIPLAFTASGTEAPPVRIGVQTVILALPILAAFFVSRTATIVSAGGIVVRAPFGRRAMPWSTVSGLAVTGRNVYAVQRDGSVRLPCVRVNDLAAVSRASGGRLPEMADPVVKVPPGRRRRR